MDWKINSKHPSFSQNAIIDAHSPKLMKSHSKLHGNYFAGQKQIQGKTQSNLGTRIWLYDFCFVRWYLCNDPVSELKQRLGYHDSYCIPAARKTTIDINVPLFRRSPIRSHNSDKANKSKTFVRHVEFHFWIAATIAVRRVFENKINIIHRNICKNHVEFNNMQSHCFGPNEVRSNSEARISPDPPMTTLCTTMDIIVQWCLEGPMLKQRQRNHR